MKWTIHKAHILMALRYAETLPGKGKGFAGKVSAGEVNICRAMEKRRLVVMGRVAPPGNGNTVALSDKGRALADKWMEYIESEVAEASPGEAIGTPTLWTSQPSDTHRELCSIVARVWESMTPEERHDLVSKASTNVKEELDRLLKPYQDRTQENEQ